MRSVSSTGLWAIAIATAQSLVAPLPGSAQQDTLRLDLAAARRIGLESSPVVAGARGGVERAMGARSQARGYAFNPVIEVKSPSFVDPGDRSPFEGIVTQELEWAGQWGLRRSAADQHAAVAEAVLRDAQRQVTLTVDLAYQASVAAQSRHEVLERGAAMGQDLVRAVTAQHQEGKVSLMELNLARIAAGRSSAEERAAERALVTARMELARAMGLPPETPVIVEAGGASDDEPLRGLAMRPFGDLAATAIAQRPDAQASRSYLDAAVSLRRLANRQMIPNLRLAAVATRSAAGDPVRWGLRVGLPVPLWNRGGGLARQASGEEAMARAANAVTELAVRMEVAAAVEDYRAAREELALYADDVLEPARQNQALLRTAYAEGELDLTTTLLLQTQLLQAELGYWDAWLRARSARARLEAAVGVASPSLP